MIERWWWCFEGRHVFKAKPMNDIQGFKPMPPCPEGHQGTFYEVPEHLAEDWLKNNRKEKRTSIAIEIPDEVFMALALMAHEQDITFNQLVTNILKEYIEIHK